MLTIRDVAISYQIFGKILHFVDNKDLGRIALMCKAAFEATVLFINSQPKSLAKAEKIELEKNFFTDSTAYETMVQWQQVFNANNQKPFEEACKQDPMLNEKATKQAEDLVTAVLPVAINFLDNFEKLDTKSDEFPGNFLNILLNSVFENMSSINQILQPNAPPMNHKITNIAHNMISDVMHHMVNPKNHENLFGFATAFAKSNFDEHTPLGDGVVPAIRPIFEMFHPIMAKHMETLGIFSTDEEMHQMFDMMKKQLNEEYGSLKDYLQKSKTPDDILEAAFLEFTEMKLDTVKTLDHQHPLANYQVDINHPKTDYEKGFAIFFSDLPSSLQEEIQPILSKMVGLMYTSAGCQTPEDFQERTEKLLKLKDKAAKQIGRIQLLRHHKEQMIAILTAQPEFDLKNLDKVNQLFDIMEKDEDVEKSFNSIYQKAMLHQFKLIKSMLNIDNTGEELTGDIFDPLFCAKAEHRYIQNMLDQMSVYWKNLTENITDPSLKLQYDVAGFELQTIAPCAFRGALHDRYERDLTQARGSKLLESGKGERQNNPIQLSSFDRTVWNYFVSTNNIKEHMDLLKMIPQVDEQTMVETLVKQTNDNHDSMIKAFFTNNVLIEEINNDDD